MLPPARNCANSLGTRNPFIIVVFLLPAKQLPLSVLTKPFAFGKLPPARKCSRLKQTRTFTCGFHLLTVESLLSPTAPTRRYGSGIPPLARCAVSSRQKRQVSSSFPIRT